MRSRHPKSNSKPVDCISALFILGTFAPKVTGSSGAGPTILILLRLNQSKLTVRRLFSIPRSKPMFHDRMVSHPNSAEIKSGAFAVLGRLLLISQLELGSWATNFINWIYGYRFSVFWLPSSPQEPRIFNVLMIWLAGSMNASRATFHPAEKEGNKFQRLSFAKREVPSYRRLTSSRYRSL